MPYASDTMRKEREKLGIKIGTFAKRLPISDSHYRHLERGRQRAAIEIFYLIARELDIPAEDVGILIADDQPNQAKDGGNNVDARGAA